MIFWLHQDWNISFIICCPCWLWLLSFWKLFVEYRYETSFFSHIFLISILQNHSFQCDLYFYLKVILTKPGKIIWSKIDKERKARYKSAKYFSTVAYVLKRREEFDNTWLTSVDICVVYRSPRKDKGAFG